MTEAKASSLRWWGSSHDTPHPRLPPLTTHSSPFAVLQLWGSHLQVLEAGLFSCLFTKDKEPLSYLTPLSPQSDSLISSHKFPWCSVCYLS